MMLGGGRLSPALDMYEHAYHIANGAKAAAYVDAFHARHSLGQRRRAVRTLFQGKLMGAIMVKIIAVSAAVALVTTARADIVNFDSESVGAAPLGWTCGNPGGGPPRWTIEADAGAPSPANVLKQSNSGPFPWCVRRGTALLDGAIEVKFKPLSSREDQAGGLIWRWKDGDNYYVVRANALQNNVSLHYSEGG